MPSLKKDGWQQEDDVAEFNIGKPNSCVPEDAYSRRSQYSWREFCRRPQAVLAGRISNRQIVVCRFEGRTRSNQQWGEAFQPSTSPLQESCSTCASTTILSPFTQTHIFLSFFLSFFSFSFLFLIQLSFFILFIL